MLLAEGPCYCHPQSCVILLHTTTCSYPTSVLQLWDTYANNTTHQSAHQTKKVELSHRRTIHYPLQPLICTSPAPTHVVIRHKHSCCITQDAAAYSFACKSATNQTPTLLAAHLHDYMATRCCPNTPPYSMKNHKQTHMV